MVNEPETAIRVLRVAEGQPGRDSDGNPSRIFSVVLSRPAGEDLGIVAAAIAPGKAEGGSQKAEVRNGEATDFSIQHSAFSVHAVRIPAPGSPHPTLAGYVARAPLIFSVGLRSKDGAMLAACSNFYNVRVRYEKKEMQNAEG